MTTNVLALIVAIVIEMITVSFMFGRIYNMLTYLTKAAEYNSKKIKEHDVMIEILKEEIKQNG